MFQTKLYGNDVVSLNFVAPWKNSTLPTLPSVSVAFAKIVRLAGAEKLADRGRAVGQLLRQPKMPDPYTTNICFGGPDLKTAYITLSTTGQLVATAWPDPGLRLAHEAGCALITTGFESVNQRTLDRTGKGAMAARYFARRFT